MGIDFSQTAHILVVHGVQTGDNDDFIGAAQVERLIDNSLARSQLQQEFSVSPFLYEDINDQAQRFFQQIGAAITAGNPLARVALRTVIDLAGDVVSTARNDTTASEIRARLRRQILQSYTAGHPLVLVAHSLGTIYALDVVNELMVETDYFSGDDRCTWPVQGLITLGSPLGLDLDIAGIRLFDQREISPLNAVRQEKFCWHNYFNRLDPVVSGQVFGSPVEVNDAAGAGPIERRYQPATDGASWRLQGHAVTAGRQWLQAHSAYWTNPKLGDCLVDLLWG